MFKKNIKWWLSLHFYFIPVIAISCVEKEDSKVFHQELESPFEKQTNKQINELKRNLKVDNLVLNNKFSENLIKQINKKHSVFAIISPTKIDDNLIFNKISDAYNFDWNYQNINKYFGNENDLFYKENNNMILEILPLLNQNKVLVNLLFVRKINERGLWQTKTVITPDYLEFEVKDSSVYSYDDKLQIYNTSKIESVINQDEKIKLNLMIKKSLISPITETKNKYDESYHWYTRMKDSFSALYFSKNIAFENKNSNKIEKSQQRQYNYFFNSLFNNYYYSRIWSEDIYEYRKNPKKYDDLNSRTKTSLIKLLAKSYLVDLNDTKLLYNDKSIINNVDVVFDNSDSLMS
ncbi:hypothetical protein BCF59_0175 [Mycoplasmopsis mustelae]|uniref:Lipoprotein n=1 Tax=Mycoplasmopsis mustelae TaxID=171289 RepID=A0A4R7UED5_9BACT|nr:hypothetical protein [Mycoplasmopsis mustelae]TDV24223.1 hypothetical protein BCF59_0175 [Mycoplasmopsis mustelae]